MIARRSVWSDSEVQELAKQFVTVADEVHRLQSGDDPECKLFQEIAEQGHYAGRAAPTNTRQGIYAATANGELLASINSNDPRRVAQMLRDALQKWEQIPADQRQLASEPAEGHQPIRRLEDHYPEQGLVLRVNSRDLPREGQATDWRGAAWNQDYAWFREHELKQMVPSEWRAGKTHTVPEPLVRRLARLHLVDNVRGQTTPYRANEVEKAELMVEVTDVEGSIANLRLVGQTRAVSRGRWSVRGFQDMNDPSPQERGFDARLLGNAKYDLDAGRFVEFELVALGSRWGATQYNGRHDDVGPAPMGVTLVLAEDTPADRIAPAFYWAYGW